MAPIKWVNVSKSRIKGMQKAPVLPLVFIRSTALAQESLLCQYGIINPGSIRGRRPAITLVREETLPTNLWTAPMVQVAR